jgi:hypothetical protein
MSLITIVVVLVVASLLVWLAQRYLQAPFQMIAVILVVLVVCIWLLSLVGIGDLRIN